MADVFLTMYLFGKMVNAGKAASERDLLMHDIIQANKIIASLIVLCHRWVILQLHNDVRI